MRAKKVNHNVESLKIALATLVFIGSFMLTCLFAIAPNVDFGNLTFTVMTFLLTGYYLWHKI